MLLCIIGGLKVFDIIIAMTNGGPGMSTQVLNTTIYSYFGSGALSVSYTHLKVTGNCTKSVLDALSV